MGMPPSQGRGASWLHLPHCLAIRWLNTQDSRAGNASKVGVGATSHKAEAQQGIWNTARNMGAEEGEQTRAVVDVES